METGKRYNEIIQYALGMGILLVALKWLEYRFVVIQYDLEMYIGLIAFVFLFLGVWIAYKIFSPKPAAVLIEKEVRHISDAFVQNEKEIRERKISKRELEVVALMAQGLSNQEIADRLFVSLNTVKTHSRNLFEKLEAKRRTQAIDTAKKLQLIPPTLR